MSIFKRIFASKVETVRCLYVCDCGKEIYSSQKDVSIMCPVCKKPMRATVCQISESDDQKPV